MTIGNIAKDAIAALANKINGNNLFVDPPQWTEKSFTLNRSLAGFILQSFEPEYDEVNQGLLFPQNDATQQIYVTDQADHKKQMDTPLKLHIHFVQDSANIPNFECDYRYYNNGEAIPAYSTFDTDSGSGPAFTYPGFPIVQILPFPEIAAPANEKVSAHLDLILRRNDNIVTGDVLAKYLDYHYLTDSIGSRQEFVK